MNKPIKRHASFFLKEPLSVMEERAKQYDVAEKEERSMDKIVEIFKQLTGHDIKVSDGYLFMVILKMVRAQGPKYHEDSFIDMASYIALAGEARVNEELQKTT